MNNEILIKNLVSKGHLKTQKIVDALLKIDRAKFVKEDFLARAYDDTALPIDSGQTISQPATVAIMLELLQVQPGNTVLDVGAGSGWTTALLSYLVGHGGKVYGVELMPSLLDYGRRNLQKFQITNATIQKAEKELGLKQHAPYDKILVSAAATQVPQELVDQLKVSGVMVVPVKNSLVKVVKTDETNITTIHLDGFVFVPLI